MRRGVGIGLRPRKMGVGGVIGRQLRPHWWTPSSASVDTLQPLQGGDASAGRVADAPSQARRRGGRPPSWCRFCAPWPGASTCRLRPSHERPGVHGHREHVEVVELLVLHHLRHVAEDARADVPDDLVVLVQLAEAVLQVGVVGAGDEFDLEDVVDRPYRDADGLRLRSSTSPASCSRLTASSSQPARPAGRPGGTAAP